MADLEYDEYNSNYDFASNAQARLADKARRWVNISGAVCSVALVLGLALWGYRLAVRDVTGIPVMRAVAGAMRIAPADPGGEQALNQGLTVNAIAAAGTSAAPSAQITLAPLAVTLQDSDVPQTAASDAAGAVPAVPAVRDAGLTVSGSTSAGSADPGASLAPAAPIVVSGTGASVPSIRPQPRPAVLSAKSAPTKVQTVSSQPAAKEIDPASIAVGTRLAQFGTFETPELARARFAELKAGFGDLMSGKAIVVQSATSGGRTFYRLRAEGFANDDEARQFCAALKAEDTDCVPVAQR